MKKIAFGFLTLMMLFGGVLLSACGERNISISVSASEVEVYTNNAQEDSFENISVTLNGSDDGIGVQLESQNDVVEVTEPTRDRSGNYTFTINALRSGNATVRVYSIEDPSVYQYINVTSYTYLEELESLDLNDQDGRSGLYVVKGDSNGKDLTPTNFFNLYPLDANVTDIVWTFAENGGTVLYQNNTQVVAEIVDNQTLYVSENCTSYLTIDLVASFVQMPSVTGNVSLEVIDSSSIADFYIGASDEDRILIRNDATESTVSGRIVVNTIDDEMTAELVAYQMRNGMYIELQDYSDYFTVSSMTYNYKNDQRIIDFTIDAQVDPEKQRLSGDVYVAFNLKYSAFTYEISTASSLDDLVLISTYFIPETLLLRDSTMSSISGRTIDLYSNYFTSYGYEVLVNVYPDDVVLNNSNYQILINANSTNMAQNPNYYLKVYKEDDLLNPITFTQSGTSTTWISEEIENGTSVYLQAGDGNYGSIADFAIQFVASGNGTATETIYANLYNITENENLDIREYTIGEDGEHILGDEFAFNQRYYISSSENSMSRDFYLRIYGYSTSTGLNLVYNQNNNFTVSYVENGRYEDVNNPDNSYVDLIVTVNVTREGYEGAFNFSFSHQTGATSETISIFAFAPIEDVVLVNNSEGSTNIYYDETNSQGFVYEQVDGQTIVSEDPNYTTNHTLSSLLMSAGSNINLGLGYGNATLNIDEYTAGYYFAYMDYDTFMGINTFEEGVDTEAIFNNLDPYRDGYNYNFITNNNNYFTYSNGYLTVASEQGEFVIYVAVIVQGYDENHDELNLMRIFKLESFYPVNSLRSNVTDARLYASESVSSTDANLTYTDVSVSLRLDKSAPTYIDLSNFSISLRNGITNVVSDEEDGLTYDTDSNGNITRAYLNSVTIENEYVTLSGFELVYADQTSQGLNSLRFRITAKSTEFNSVWNEIVNLTYELNYENVLVSTLSTNINIEIIQADRVENVTWINETEDGEIYLNIASNDPAEQSFIISTSISPNYAENRNLTYHYQQHNQGESVLEIRTDSISQSFSLTIGNRSRGGYGYLYILPEDMVKIVNGIRQIVIYGVDENGDIETQAQYLPLSQIDNYYEELIGGTYETEYGTIANYFINNYNERVYYSDIILKIRVTVSDGLSEETAIRVYSQSDLENVENNLYYRVMNDIDLVNFNSIGEGTTFSGMIFGNTDDVTLSFANNSESLVDRLSGTIKNLTMTGNVVGGGFVANYIQEGGLVDNVTVDVNYENGNYLPSTLTQGVAINGNYYAGGIAGQNMGTISNSNVFGLEIDLNQNGGYTNTVAGGIVGYNLGGRVENCGVEFYNFIRTESTGEEDVEVTYNNKITANVVGGIIGQGGYSLNASTGAVNDIRIINSYVYAFNLIYQDGDSPADISGNSYTSVLNGQGGAVGAFVGSLNVNGSAVGATYFRLVNSFAFLGDYRRNNVNSNIFNDLSIGQIEGSGSRVYQNSYITYFEIVGETENTGDGETTVYRYRLKMDYVLNDSTTEEDLSNVRTLEYSNIDSIDYSEFDSSVWETNEIDQDVNFGFAYLRDVNQNIAVSVDQTIQTVDGKTINADYVDGDSQVKAGILFLYQTQENVTNAGAQSEINRANTISITDLFGVTEREAQSLLISVDRENFIGFTTNNITALRTNINLGQTIKLTLYSRVDFSDSQTYEIMVINYVPELTLTTGNTVISDGDVLNIQTRSQEVDGSDNSRQVQVVLDYSTYFNGEEYHLVSDDAYSYSVSYENNTSENGDYISNYVSGNNITFIANSATGNDYVNTTINLNFDRLKTNYSQFNDALTNYRKSNFYISSYLGANSLIVDARDFNITPDESVSFNAEIISDSKEEDLSLTFTYNDRDYFVDENNQVVINDNLVLDVDWTKETDGTRNNFKVVINVNRDYRHKVDATYDFVISINALSQNNNTNLLKTINFVVQKQRINKVNVTAYTISSRTINNSRWYYTPSTTISSTLVPGSDSILTLEVSPNFAHFSQIEVTYTASSSGMVGTVGISRLSYNSTYGYYIDSSTTDNITSGLRVTPTDSDLQNGVYYFRIYVSSSFTSNSNVTLRFTFYDETENVGSYTYNYVIDYLSSAEVLVDGAHSVMLAKGDSAQVSITLDLDQTLTNNSIRLENNGTSIYLSSITEEVTDSFRRYTATISTSVTSNLADGNSTGAFYVYASVSRYVNGILDYVESYATVYLVDFTINADETKVVGTTDTATYNGNTYDAFYSYINANQTLAFDYVIEPETYNFDPNNNEEYQAVYGQNGLMAKRRQFVQNGSYRDDVSGYYINYSYNSTTGTYTEIPIEQRLYYVNNDGSATAIYNSQRGEFVENSIIEFSSGSNDTLVIKGLRIGSVLLRLTTTVVIGNTTFEYNYDFVVVISIWTDEEVPMPIYTAEEFLNFAAGNPDEQGNVTAADYILMNDIVLENYTPVDTTYFRSLDGNGYQIYISSFNTSGANSTLNLALFNQVASTSTIKNVRVNLYNAGQLTINVNQFTNINIAGFALTNNGTIYNCEVVAYYDENHSVSRVSGNTGIVVNFVRGNGTDYVHLTSQDISVSNVNISGFVNTNNSIITNSRVGGTSIGTVIETDDPNLNYYSEVLLPLFTIQGQGTVAGFVNNNVGTISASFANNVQINNQMNSTTSITSGFAVNNTGDINTSYTQGAESESSSSSDGRTYYFDGSTIASTGRVAGFIYNNSGIVKNSYVNIAFEVDISRSYLSAGFVYQNNEGAEITLCYAAAKMSLTDINEMSFSGVSENGTTSLNTGTISNSYYYNTSRVDTTTQSNFDVGAYSITDVGYESTFYRFSFASEENAYDGIWTMTDDGITLTSANKIAFSNRYIVYNSEEEDDYYFLYRTLTDLSNYRQIDLSYGSENNPIIIRSAADFAKATGKAQETEISSYKRYYNDTEVFGTYRLVNDIDFSEIDQNVSGENNILLTTTSKTFSGILDGNSFTISNISLGASTSMENYGLFARLEDGVIMNLGLQVVSVHNANARIVGTLAGTAIDSRLIAINLSPNERRDDEEAIEAVSIEGYNIVGGLVGIVMGDSILNDITVTNIDVNSAYYYGANKSITYNSNFTGDNLRQLVYLGSSLTSLVRSLSYAGGVAGYVDIYTNIGDGYVKYSSQTDLTDYEVVSIKVLDSVDIFGEVAGGLFGYLGRSLMAYDLGIELDADMALNSASYITSKNLYAGGIVGESYAGLYAVYAKYEDTLQSSIERGIYNYYNGGGSERGQLSIFSYSSLDTRHQGRYNSPLYIGGLVGYAGAGYIAVGYNKLNVTSNIERSDYSYTTEAVGGIVGYISSDYNYDADFISENVNISYYLYEVYFSGVLYSETNANAGGIVGDIDVNNDIALNKVNSIPYYDTAESVNNVYSLVAGFKEEDNGNLVDTLDMSDAIYLLDARGDYHNVINSLNASTSGSVRMSVATSNQYLIDAGKQSSYINGLSDDEVIPSGLSYRPILEMESLANIPTTDGVDRAHSAMASYFLQNNWDDTRWEHESDQIFPDIILYPKDEVIWLDADPDSIASMLEAVKDRPNATVVVRGRVNEDVVGDYADVDLRGYEEISSFGGTFISYNNYMHSNDEGIISSTANQVRQIKRGTNGGSDTSYVIGGYEGDEVGLILSSPLFTSTESGLTIDGLNIYLAVDSNEDNEAIGDNSDDSTEINLTDSPAIVSGTLTSATLIDLNIFINGNLNITSSQTNIGLIAESANSTNFQSINFIFRYENLGTTVNNPKINLNLEANTADSNGVRNFGLLVGELEQNNVYNSTTVSNIIISSEEKNNRSSSHDNLKLEANIINNNYVNSEYTTPGNINNSLSFGFLIGQTSITDGETLPLNFGINNLIDDTLSGINLTIEGAEVENAGNNNANQSLNDLYFGGYIGRANLRTVSLIGGVNPVSLIKNFIVHQKISVNNNMYFGLGFGELTGNGEFSLNALSTGSQNTGLDVTGGLYQFESVTTGTTQTSTSDPVVNVGGFIGSADFTISLTSALNVNFDVKGNQPLEDAEGNETTFEDYDKGVTSQNSINGIYSAKDFNNVGGVWTTETSRTADNEYTAEVYTVNGQSNIGTFVGRINSGTFSFSEIYISEYSDIQISNASGSTSSNSQLNETNIGTIGLIENGMFAIENGSSKYSGANYFVETNGIANVGGLIGKANALSQFRVQSYMYDGTVVSFANTLNFGGLAGNVRITNSGNLQSVIYGGTLKNFVKSNNDNQTVNNIYVGGIIGSVDVSGMSGNNSLNINGAYSYGDVFVAYESANATLNLTTFMFGGIIGSINDGDTNSNVSLVNSYSLMTPFNDRLVDDGLNGAHYRINALVGQNEELVNYGQYNYYSSGVTMSYQYEGGINNIDVSYGFNDENYYGYSAQEIEGNGNNADLSGQISNDSDSEGIIEVIKNAIQGFTTMSQEVRTAEGAKLNPTRVVESGDSGDDEVSFAGISSNSNTAIDDMQIKWYYFEEDINIADEDAGSVNTNSLNNVVIVGNGKTITYTPTSLENNQISVFKSIGTTDDTFSAISGLVVDIDFDFDLVSDNVQMAGLVQYIGQNATNPSIMIYAVGVTGNVELGSTGTANFGGIVSNMYRGMISNSYADLDIFYHAGANRQVSGGQTYYFAQSTLSAITNVQDGLVEIYNTFAMGNVKSYVPANIYTFNSYSTYNETQTYRTRIFDSYSVMQVETEDYGFNNNSGDEVVSYGNYNISNFQASTLSNSYYSDYSGLIGVKTRIEGTNYITEIDSSNRNGIRSLVDNMSIGYNDANEVRYKIDNTTGDIYSPWFYSPYRNYGYGTTGFVYLRNTSTYSREKTNIESTAVLTSGENATYAYNTYEYTKLSEEELATLNKTTGSYTITIEEGNTNSRDYFLAITNVGKFRQLVGLDGGNRKFFLKYDINLSDLSKNNDTSWNYNNSNLGSTNNMVVLDGQNHLIEFENAKGLFINVYANMENLRVINYEDINTPNYTEAVNGYRYFGVLAGTYTGKLINVTVQGDIEFTGATDYVNKVGGVVGKFTGTIISAENLVNISIENGANVVGGIVGEFNGDADVDDGLVEDVETVAGDIVNTLNDGTISYSSNNGTIVAKTSLFSSTTGTGTPSNTTTGLVATTSHNPYNDGGDSSGSISTQNEPVNRNSNLVTVLGGIAGYVSEGTIDHAYNNATVMNNYDDLSRYTVTFERNLASGGIVGYSNGDITNSLNMGYVVSGNNKNTGVALAGGIVGYSTGNVSTSYNDAKVQAVSFIDASHYKITMENLTYEKKGQADSGSNNVDFTFKIEYNIHDEQVEDTSEVETIKDSRLVMAYGIGYINGGSEEGNANFDTEEIVNDGNIGYTVRRMTPSFEAQRYSGGDTSILSVVDNVDNIVEYYDYYLATGEDGEDGADIRISAYDSYGFPSRFNYYYSYSFDITGFNHNYNSSFGPFMSFMLTDRSPNTTLGDTQISNYSETTSLSDNIYPGGESTYYFSIPLYNTTTEFINDGNSYEELVEDISNLNSNLNRTNSGDVDETDFDNLYSDINAVREAEDDVTDESINVNGKEYTYVSSSGDFTSFTGGVGISGTIDIKVPKVNYSYEDGLLDPGSLTVRPIRVSSIDFGLHIDETNGVSVNDDLLTNLEAIGANVRISEENGSYFLNYTAYYNRSELANALGLTSGSNVQDVIEAIQLDVQYNLIYQYSTEITLTKRNLNKFTNARLGYGVEVDMITNNNGYQALSIGEYLDEYGFADYYNGILNRDEELDNLEVYFTNSGTNYYYDTQDNIFVEMGDSVPANVLTLDLIRDASLSNDENDKIADYLGVLLRFSNDLTRNRFINKVTDAASPYTMNIVYYVQGNGAYDQTIGGSTTFNASYSRAVNFPTNDISNPNGSYVTKTDNGNSAVFEFIVDSFDGSDEVVINFTSSGSSGDSSSATITLNIDYNASTVDDRYSYTYGSGVSQDYSTGNYYIFGTGSEVSTWPVRLTTGVSGEGNPTIILTSNNDNGRIYITNANVSRISFTEYELDLPSEYNRTTTIEVNGNNYDVTGIYKLKLSGNQILDENDQVIDGYTYSNGTLTREQGADSNVTLYYTYDRAETEDGLQVASASTSDGGINIVYIANDGFYYSLYEDENGNLVNGTEDKGSGNYVQMIDGDSDSAATSINYTFYSTGTISSFHGINVTSGNYIVTEAKYPNGMISFTLCGINDENPKYRFYRIAQYRSDNQPGLEYLITYMDNGNIDSYKFIRLTKNETNDLTYAEIDDDYYLYNFSQYLSRYILDEDFGTGAFLEYKNSQGYQNSLNLTFRDLDSYELLDNASFSIIRRYNQIDNEDLNGMLVEETENISNGNVYINGDIVNLGDSYIYNNQLFLRTNNGQELQLLIESQNLNVTFSESSEIKLNYYLNENNQVINSNTGEIIGTMNENGDIIDGDNNVIGTVDDNGNITFNNGFQGSEEVIVSGVEIKYTFNCQASGNANDETYQRYIVEITINEAKFRESLKSNDSMLVANNITETTSNYDTTIPKVQFTENSLASYSGNEVIFNAANFGPTETVSSTEMYFGPSTITFDVGIDNINPDTINGDISLDVSSSKDIFDEDTNLSDDNTHSVSIGVDDTAQEFGSFTDYYEFELTIPFIFNNQKDETLTADDFASSNGNIIISDNIYIQDMSTTINGLNATTMEVKGYNHLITQKLSLGTFYYAVRVGATGYLQDLVFAISADADPGDERASVNVFDVVSSETGGTRVSNVLIYGTIRQISADKFLNSGTNAGSITVLNASSSNATSMESNMSLIGADGLSGNSVWQNGDGFDSGNGKSVLVTLQSKTGNVTFADNSILVAGNGGNGSNGTDGERSTQINSPNGEDGSSGGNGGNGGSVSGGTISISGADGTAGNGGNGADGLNASKTISGTYSKRSNNLYNYSSDENRDNGVAGGGGAGGDSGETDAEKSMTNRQYKDIAGSGGSGGLGMFYSGVENYETEYYHKYSYTGSHVTDKYTTGGGYSDDGYSNNPQTDSSNLYSSWIKTSGGGGAAGDTPNIEVKNGSQGEFISPNINILRRGFNRFRGNTTSTSGYYWNYKWTGDSSGEERLFGNLQMISTFSYYGTTPQDTGPMDVIWGLSNHYVQSSDIIWLYVNESAAFSLLTTGIRTAIRVAKPFLRIPMPWKLIPIAALAVAIVGVGIGFSAVANQGNSTMVWGHAVSSNEDQIESIVGAITQLPGLGLITGVLQDAIQGLTDLVLEWVTDDNAVVFRNGSMYFADGGIGDYWWLYNANNLAYETNRNYTDFAVQFGKYLDGISNNRDTNPWENNFYGGLGAGDGTGINGNGGTAYTSEIYGYAKLSLEGDINKVSETNTPVYKCFFTRNDMVTSSGKYGDAGKTDDSNATSGLESLGNFIDGTKTTNN